MGTPSLTLSILERTGIRPGTALFRRVFVFVAYNDVQYTSGLYQQCLGDWAARIVVGVPGADEQVAFIQACFPLGQHVVFLDDNLDWMKVYRRKQLLALSGARGGTCEMQELIEKAGEAMIKHNANLWGISQTNNKFYVEKAPYMRTGLELVYGACFGVRVLHESSLDTRYGQVKDDLERTLRYWHRDKVVLRFSRYAVKKRKRPGTFGAKAGGISASVGRDGHAREQRQAVRLMVAEFARPYVRLPRPSTDQMHNASGQLCYLASGEPKWKSHVCSAGVVFKRRRCSP